MKTLLYRLTFIFYIFAMLHLCNSLTYANPAFDFDGVPRPQGSGYDIGAFEYSMIPCVTNADCNDGLYCNGTETCVNNICQYGSTPCSPGTICNENTNSCELVTTTTTVPNTTTTVPPGTSTDEFGDATNTNHPGTSVDSYLNVGSGGDVNYSSDNQELNTYTWPANTAANRITMKWNLSAIPANATIISATLSLYLYESGGDSQYDVSVHKIVNLNPVISSCTWNTCNGVDFWTGGANGGAQDMAVAEDTITINTTPGYKSWDITNMAQDWVLNPSSNFGLMLDSDSTAAENSYRFFRPTEYANPSQRPKLIINFTVGEDSTPPAAPTGLSICGDNIKGQSEECDGTDAASCPGQCQVNCNCP